MIIYEKDEETLVIPCGLGPVVCIEPGYELQQKTADSSTVLQDITADEDYYGLSKVTITPVTSDIDPNIQADNIKRDVEILGVTGTFDGGPLQSKTVDSSTSSQTIEPDNGNYGLSSVTVNPYILDSKTVDSSTVSQTIVSSEDGLSSVTVNPYTLDSKTVNSSTAQQVITSDEDGLSSVIVEPYVLDSKTVDSSTVSQVITSDEDGLSSVTVNPYTLDSKTVDSSTVSQTVVSSEDGLSSVTVNPYVLDSKTVNSSTAQQVITSSEDGLSSVTVEPYVLDSKTVDSSTVSQVITSDEDGLSSVTVNPYILDSKTVDSSTVSQTVVSSENGLSSVTVNPYTLDSKTVDSSTVSQVITSDEDGLLSVTVNPYVLDSKTVNSSTAQQVITSSEDGLSSVTVEPYVLDSKTVDSSTVSQTVVSSEDGLSSVTVNPYVLDSKTVNPSTNSQTVNSSADGLSSVTINAVTSSIDQNIIAENIKKDIDILGVTGTYEGSNNKVYLDVFAIEKTTQNNVKIVTDYVPNASVNRISGFIKIDSSYTDNNYIYKYSNDCYAYYNGTLGFSFGSGYGKLVLFSSSEIDFTGVQFDASLAGITWLVTANGVTKTCSNGTSQESMYNLNLLPHRSGNDSSRSLSYLTFETSTDSWTFSPVAIADVSNNNITNYSSLAIKQVHTVNGTDTVSYITEDNGGNLLLDNYRFVTYKANTSTGEIMDLSNASKTVMFPIGGYPSGVKLPNHNLGTKTVDSSTVSQTVTPGYYYGLSSVTVNPYTVEADSSTLTINGTYVFTPQNADALSSVTVDVSINTVNNQSKTVDSSTSSQNITPDNGYTGLDSVTINPYVLDSKSVNSSTAQQVVTSDEDGLSSVTVEPYVLDSKTVDSSTVSQVITSSEDGLLSVTVNPYTVESDSSTLTVNGTYTFTPTNADALSSVTIDVSVQGQVINNQNKTVDSSTSSQTITFDSGYTGLNEVVVNPYVLDSSTVNPSTSQITVTSSEDGLSSVTINAVTASIDANITAENIKKDVVILGVTGTLEGGGGTPEYDAIYAALIQI